MTFTEEEAIRVKEHLLTQLDNFPEDRRKQIKNQIESMTTEQVETFIEQNKLTHLNNKCIFCAITKDEAKSYKISENDSNIAILEINPLSVGHSLIVPLEHKDGITELTKELAEDVSEKLKDIFKPKAIDSKEINIMGHPLIELIPIYGGEVERHQASEEELKSLQEEIITEEIPETKEELKEVNEVLPKLPPRIP